MVKTAGRGGFGNFGEKWNVFLLLFYRFFEAFFSAMVGCGGILSDCQGLGDTTQNIDKCCLPPILFERNMNSVAGNASRMFQGAPRTSQSGRIAPEPGEAQNSYQSCSTKPPWSEKLKSIL